MPEQLHNGIETFTSPEQREQTTRAICTFFENKLTGLEARAVDNPSGYVQQFYELCTGSTRPWTRQKEFDMIGLSLPLRIRFDQHGDYAPELRRLCIDIRPLLQARSKSELTEAII